MCVAGRAGTCLYMAPEITRQEPYNEKVDTFSFGVVLFEVRQEDAQAGGLLGIKV